MQVKKCYDKKKHFGMDVMIKGEKKYNLGEKNDDLLPFEEIESVSKIINSYIKRSGKSGRQAVKDLSKASGVSVTAINEIKFLSRDSTKGTLPNPTHDTIKKIVNACGYTGGFWPKDVPL